MTETVREKWLVLDDCTTDLMRMMQVVESGGADALLASTVSEAEDLLQRHKVDLCLFDYFLRGTTSRQLIMNVRKQDSRMPIVVVSNQAGKDEVLYRVGADNVVPKLTDPDAFSLVIRNGASHARSLRATRPVEGAGKWRPHIPRSLRTKFDEVLASTSGNALVVSSAGMGRSSLAHALAEGFLDTAKAQKGFDKKKRPRLLSFTCSTERSFEAANEALFGAADGTTGLLSSARNGVLLIEDVHLLSEELQERLAGILFRNKVRMNDGTTAYTESLRMVFTAKPNEGSLSPKLLKTAAKATIRMPAFSKLNLEWRQFVLAFLARETQSRLTPEKGLVKKILMQIALLGDQVTLQSLALAIETAVQRAGSEGRCQVLISDFGDFKELTDERAFSSRPSKQLVLDVDDRIGVESIETLYRVLRFGTLSEAETLLRKMMIDYSMFVHRGNKSRVARQLGIARGHLYRQDLPNMKRVQDEDNEFEFSSLPMMRERANGTPLLGVE